MLWHIMNLPNLLVCFKIFKRSTCGCQSSVSPTKFIFNWSGVYSPEKGYSVEPSLPPPFTWFGSGRFLFPKLKLECQDFLAFHSSRHVKTLLQRIPKEDCSQRVFCVQRVKVLRVLKWFLFFWFATLLFIFGPFLNFFFWHILSVIHDTFTLSWMDG